MQYRHLTERKREWGLISSSSVTGCSVMQSRAWEWGDSMSVVYRNFNWPETPSDNLAVLNVYWYLESWLYNNLAILFIYHPYILFLNIWSDLRHDSDLSLILRIQCPCWDCSQVILDFRSILIITKKVGRIFGILLWTFIILCRSDQISLHLVYSTGAIVEREYWHLSVSYELSSSDRCQGCG